MSTPDADARLQLRLARGEEAALGELYDRFAPLVHGLATRVLNDQDAAEQLTREVFAQLWTDPASWRPDEGSLRSWLGTLTHRRAVEHLHRLAGHGPAADDAAPGSRTPVPAGRSAP
ncbi:sigma factor [Kitasatospora sp. NBC_01539]|uniref:sigma factor n=1 Tax=Kitasatospora sp. NBC_01539 TaxID=2903577 RepID=UPI003860219C